MELRRTIGKIGRPIWRHSALGRIARGEVTPTQLRDFILQRHALTEGFVELLQTIILNTDDDNLKRCVSQNLGDETGHGVENDAHATWRAHYLLGLGIEPTHNALLLEGTQHYNQVLRELMVSGNPYSCAGALLLLERSIPPEFARIRFGLETVLPHIFRLKSGDSTAEHAFKQRVRQYLVDHEHHDARFHEPDLRRALTTSFQEWPTHNDIIQGAELIASAKVHFYDSIAEYLGG